MELYRIMYGDTALEAVMLFKLKDKVQMLRKSPFSKTQHRDTAYTVELRKPASETVDKYTFYNFSKISLILNVRY